MIENTENQPLTKAAFQMYMEAFSEDIVNNSKVTADVAEAINNLAGKVDKVTAQIQLQQSGSMAENDTGVDKIIGKEITDIKQLLKSRPENTSKKFQVLLFPEQDRKLFYKVVFGRWLLLLAIMLLLNNLFKFGVHWSDNRKEVALRQIENDRVRKAWDRLYENSNKERKREMDHVYKQSLKQQ